MQEQEQAGKEQSFKMLPHATVCTKDCAVAIVDTDINMLGKEEEVSTTTIYIYIVHVSDWQT